MIIAIIVFAILLCIGMPIAIALGLFGITHIATMGNPAFFDIITGRMFSGVNIISISCIPFFIMAGELMNGGGITRRLLDFLRTFIGRLKGGMAYCTTCEGAAEVTAAVRRAWPRHMIVKLSPNVTSIADIAKAVEAAGADSVSLINTILGMAVDVERRRPYLSTITGGLSGAAVRPIAVRMVWQVSKAVSIPVVGLGGIMNGRDALEFIMAGARAVEVGTANFIDPSVTMKIIDEITDFCTRQGVSDINELVGII